VFEYCTVFAGNVVDIMHSMTTATIHRYFDITSMSLAVFGFPVSGGSAAANMAKDATRPNHGRRLARRGPLVAYGIVDGSEQASDGGATAVTDKVRLRRPTNDEFSALIAAWLAAVPDVSATRRRLSNYRSLASPTSSLVFPDFCLSLLPPTLPPPPRPRR